MSKSTIQKRITIDEQIKQLEKQRKQLIREEKSEAEKARMKRVSNRGIFIEKLMPSLANMTDNEFESYMKKALSPPVLQADISTNISAKGSALDDK